MRLSAEVKAGVTVVLSVVLFAAMVFAVERIDFRRAEGQEITLVFDNVGGLIEGAPVRYAGVNVGTVAAVQLVGSQVLVKVRLNRELLIPADSRFMIAATGILGDKYIEIQPGQTQEPLDLDQTIAGISPVSIDSMIQEVETGLRNLNEVIVKITEVAGSEELQENLAATGELMKETMASLKYAVDQVALVAENVQVVVDDLAEFSRQMPELDLQSTFADIQAFSQQLANLNLADPINEINVFAARLNALPLEEFTADVQRVAQQLAALDLAAIEADVLKFTSMLASVEIQPLIDEILLVTEQIKSLELDQRSAEIAAFTAQLGTLPLGEIAADLQTISRNLALVPVEDIAVNIRDVTEKLAGLPIDQVVSDLQVVASELKNIGWREMAVELSEFTNELASFDFDTMLTGVTEDLNRFSHTLASLRLDELLASVAEVVENLREVSTAVDPNSVSAIMADLEGISANVHAVTAEINKMVAQINVDVQSFSRETLVALQDIQSIVTGVDESIARINLFIDDVTAEGETAANIRATLANIEAGTQKLAELLSKVSDSFDSDTGVFVQLQETMDTIQKLNEDIERVKTMGEKVDIHSKWGVHATLTKEPSINAGVSFEFWPQDTNSFILVGIKDILGDKGNRLQLQYGRQTGFLRQRYGIIDTSLGVGLDGQFGEKWGWTAELKELTTGFPWTLSLEGRYTWTPNWMISLIANDIFSREERSFRIGVERSF